VNFFPHSAQTAIEPGVRFSYLPFFGTPSGFPANKNSSFFCFFNNASLFAEFFRFEAAEEERFEPDPDPDATAFAEVEAMGDAEVEVGEGWLGVGAEEESSVVRVREVEVEASSGVGVAELTALGCRTLPAKLAPGPVIPCSCRPPYPFSVMIQRG